MKTKAFGGRLHFHRVSGLARKTLQGLSNSSPPSSRTQNSLSFDLFKLGADVEEAKSEQETFREPREFKK